jgi:hypothetical protein
MSRTNSNSRSGKYFGRKIETRELRERFLIVCEGEKTEPRYFKSFRVPKDVVHVKPAVSAPTTLVDTAKELYNKEYTQVWCVFDRDDWTPQNFNHAIQVAEKSGFKVAYSNEAFELWYVLHFEFMNTGIPRSDYIRKLDKLLGHKYEKNSSTIYEELENRQSTAIKNADNLLKQYEQPNPEKDNPSTTVHKLVQELNKFLI